MEKEIVKQIPEPNSGLMKKTKAQLVEIILRKDEVERSIRKELKEAEEFASQKIKDYNALNETHVKYVEDLGKANYNIELMQEEYREQCDEHASERQELIDKVNRYKTLFYFVLMIIMVLGIYIIL